MKTRKPKTKPAGGKPAPTRTKKNKKVSLPTALEEQRFRALIENSLEAIALLDAQGRLIYDSPAAGGLLGLSPQEWIGKSVFDLIHPQDIGKVQGTLAEILEHPGRPFKSLFRVRRKDGAWLWIEAVATNRLADDVIGAIVVNYRDITETRQAEEARRASEHFRRLIVDTEPECVKLIAPNGTLMEMNPAGLAMIEADSLEQVRGTPITSIVAPEYRHAFAALHKRVMDGETGTLEFEIIGLKGTRRWLETRAVPLRTTSEKIEALLGVTRDITEHKRAEAALRESNERFRELWENTVEGIAIHYNGVFLEVNPAICRMFGYTPEQVIGRSIFDFISPEVARVVREKMLEGSDEPYEVPAQRADGTSLMVELIGKSITYRGRPVRMVAVRDITARKQAEEALRRSEERYRVLTEASHDMITLLNRELKVEYTNTFAARQIGAAPREMIGKPISDFFPPEISRRQEANLRRVIESGESAYIEAPVLFGDRTAWLGSWLVPITEGDREVTSVLIVSRDITTRRRAEEALRLNEERYRALFEETPISIWEEDFSRVKQYIDDLKAGGVTDFRSYFTAHHAAIMECVGLVGIVDINKAALQMYQAESREELIRNFTKVIDAGPAASFLEELICIAEGRTTYSWEGPDRTLTGQPIEVSLRWAVAPGHEEDYSKVIVSIIDITERKRADEKIQRQVRHLSALHEIDQAIGASVDLRITLDVFLRHTVSQLKVDAAAILLFNPGMLTLEYAAWHGFAATRQTQLRLDESHAGRAVLERNTVHIPNFSQAIPLTQSRLLSEEGFDDYYAVPLMAKGQVKGVLEIFHRSSIGLELDWLDFLETLSGQAAIAIDNAQLFEDLQRSNTSLTLAYDATIEGWSRAMDLRDKETEGHTLRVTSLTLDLARAMRVNDAEMIHIRRGALLHDIGKLGIPDHILLKADELTDEEWAIMRKHPTYAYDMLSSIAYLVPALDIPYAHHEKWDGTGYPRGLKGQQIPLAARIFAVVDVWDAITSDRPYRPAWEKGRALEFIRSESGKHFDPQVVDAFLRMVDAPA